MTSPFKRIATVLSTVVLLLAGIPLAASGAPVDDYAEYDPQSTCVDEVLPGTDFLLRLLVRQHPGTRYASALRACSSSTSEHQDGRALDWGVDADDPREKAMADAWLEKIFATDRRGNPHALARRMGIMYVIWDDHIYSAYRRFEKRLYTSCDPRWKCSKTTRHRDHVHVSLSRSGAAAQTTFYRARNVPSVPVLYPGTKKLDPVSTAEVTFDVPATGETVTTDFKLARGETYRLVADGLVRKGAGNRVADPVCRWTRRNGWVPSGTLQVNGATPFAGTCKDSHTYEAFHTPGKTDFLRLRVDEDTPRDAAGALTFSILREDINARTVASKRVPGSAEPQPASRSGKRARPLVKERFTVPAARANGVLTDRAVRRKHSYRVVVKGTAQSGSTMFDGQCVRYAGRLRPQHTLDLTRPQADHLSLYVQGVKVELRVPKATRRCNATRNRYVGKYQPVRNGRARVKVWDPYTYEDNSGGLTVLLRRR